MTAEILKQKEGRASVEALLKQARADLIGSSRPGVAELAKAREEARKEMIERRHLEQKVESMTRELDFFRAQYQEASSAAAEAGAEVHILRDEIEILKKKASGEAVKLRQMAISTENERHSRRILELEATLKERDEHLRRKEEEMKSQARGKGVVMRASSAPKSPKPSRAGSPNPLTGSVPTTVVTVPAANNGGYGPIPGVGAVGRGGGHPLRYSGHPLPME
jgi:chromosome segregation ATPase